jgi:putative pre-16S rRNA nuclease
VTRLIGVDLGERRIGLAVGDGATGVVRPLATLRRARTVEDDARTLATLLGEQHAGELVVGLPLDMRGTEGEQARRTRAWAEAVAAILGVPLVLRDERLTSVVAEAAMGGQPRGSSGGPPSAAARNRRRARIDREAARLILEAELSRRDGARAR